MRLVVNDIHNKKKIWLLLILVVSIVTAIMTKLGLLTLVLTTLVVLSMVVLIVTLFFYRPGLLLLIYLLLLPTYTLSLAFLYRITNSTLLINLLQPWKEVAALLVLSLVLLKMLARNQLPKPHIMDILVLLFFSLNFLYLILPSENSLIMRVYGFRANVFWVIIYWLGRLVSLSLKLQKWILMILIAIGTLAGIMVLIELVLLPIDWPQRLGLMDYLSTFFDTQSKGHYGLTWTFETSTGIRRRSAFFANPLELASSALITGSAALIAILYYRPRTWGRTWISLAFGLIVFSLILSFSRASIISFCVQMFIISLWLRKRMMTIMLVIAIILGAFLTVSIGGSRVSDFIMETIAFENPSSQGHLSSWLDGLEAIAEQPWGLGLGSSGRTGDRFGNQVGGENQFVIIGVDLGIVGLLLYGLILLSSIWFALKAFYRTQGITKALAFVAATSKLGLLIPTFTSHIEIYIFAMFVTWWLVGFSIQQLLTNDAYNNNRSLSQEASLENSY